MKPVPTLIFVVVNLAGFLACAETQVLPVTIGPGVTKFLGPTNAFAAEADLSQGGGQVTIQFFYDPRGAVSRLMIARSFKIVGWSCGLSRMIAR